MSATHIWADTATRIALDTVAGTIPDSYDAPKIFGAQCAGDTPHAKRPYQKVNESENKKARAKRAKRAEWPNSRPPPVHFAETLLSYLPKPEQVLATSKQSACINWQRFTKQDSPFAKAIKHLDQHCPLPWNKSRSYHAKRKNLKRCFDNWFGEGRTTDAKRVPKNGPSGPEMRLIADILTKERWQDGYRKAYHRGTGHF